MTMSILECDIGVGARVPRTYIRHEHLAGAPEMTNYGRCGIISIER